MNNKNLKISYNKEAKVLSVEMRKMKSVDSDIHDNIVIDYDKRGKVVRVNFYDFNFDAFQESRKELKNFTRNFKAPLLVK